MIPRSIELFAAAGFTAVFTASCHRAEREAAAANNGQTGTAISLRPEQTREAEIEVAPVYEHIIDEVVQTSGRVALDDLKVAHVYSPVTGRVIRIDAPLGAHVSKGAPLALLQSPDVGQASADLAKADADLVAAEHDFRRKKELMSTQAGSAADFEAAEDRYRQAVAEKDRAQKRMALFQAGAVDRVKQGYALQAPIEGEVLARSANPGLEVQGQYAGANSPVELFTIGSLESVWVLADIYEEDIARVAPGEKVTVAVTAYQGVEFHGVVDWVSSTLDPGTRTAKVRCTLENPGHRLLPDMYTTIRVAVPGHPALAVPCAAVTQIDDQSFVFVETGASSGRIQFERWPVAVDRTGSSEVWPVLHGLEPGTRIVTRGADVLAQRL